MGKVTRSMLCVCWGRPWEGRNSMVNAEVFAQSDRKTSWSFFSARVGFQNLSDVQV